MSVSRGELDRVAGLLRKMTIPWFVCGGWAIDLFVGHQTREHSDLEIGIFREDQSAVRRHFLSWHPGKVVEGPSGPLIVPWYDGEFLMLPIHQVKLYLDGFSPREFEFFLNDTDGDQWFFRRKPEITMPKDRLIRVSAEGTPYVAPEVQLLYKSRMTREQDQHDFDVAFPLLIEGQRAWLRDALQSFQPGHDWLDRLLSP
jgi:hypothetical protein